MHRVVSFLLVVIAVLAAGCITETGTIPARPPGLPADAAWVGGPDGGVFVQLAQVSSREYDAAVYYQDGELRHKGRFVRKGEGQDMSRLTTADLAGFDGTQLLLKQGGSLVSDQEHESPP